MCLNFQKKILLFLPFLILLFISAASPQDTLKEKKFQKQTTLQNSANNSQTNVQLSNNNSNLESKNVNSSNNQLTQQELESMNAWTLLDNLDLTITRLEQRVATQDLLLANSETELLNTKTELLNSKQLVKTLKEALISNKEDASIIIQIAGELQSEIDSLTQMLNSFETRLRRSHIYSNISNPILFTSGIIGGIGGYILFKGVVDEDSTMIKTGSTMLAVSGIALISFEITFNGGIKLKLW